MEQCYSGIVEQRYIGTVVPWNSDKMVQWCNGTANSSKVAQWCRGLVVQRQGGAEARWCRSTVVQWYSITVLKWHKETEDIGTAYSGTVI